MKCLCAEDGATRWVRCPRLGKDTTAERAGLTHCHPRCPAFHQVEHLFGDCLYTAPDRVSFALGLASVGESRVSEVSGRRISHHL